MNRRIGVSLAVVLALGACNDQQDPSPTEPGQTPSLAVAQPPKKFVISLVEGGAPSDLADRVAQAGGKLKKVHPEMGVAVAESEAADFAAKLSVVAGIEAVGQDRLIQWIDPNLRVQSAGEVVAPAAKAKESIGDDETFYGIQWAPKAVHAPEAWARGARGTGVRVAVLDGGLNNNHIDLAGSVDVARSASMVAGFAFNQDVPGFSHSTHVSGIVAAQNDGVGTIGVAPGATIIGVKVLHNGSGSFEDVIEGIRYAATPIAEGGAGADIINMSLGATFEPEKGDKALITALDKATKFAHKQKVVVIASAGNDGLNLDKEKKTVTIPAQSAEVLAISATGPLGFALGAKNFSRPASYSNFGLSLVNFGAPGGDFALPGEDLCTMPLPGFGTITNRCWVFDMVISPASIPSTTGYSWAAGTSMAAPMAAGIAALIIEKNPGMKRNPDRVAEELRRSSDDLGKRGFDEFYGDGFVNARKAVK